MALNLRTLAIAASLCTVLPLTAQASVLTLDFEDLSLVPGTSLDLVATQPYASKLLSFSGAVFADKWSIGEAGAAGIPQPPASAGPNFAGGLHFDLLIDSSACTSANAGKATYGCFNRLNMSTLAASGFISIYDSSSSVTPALIVSLAGGGGGTSKWSSIGTAPLETVGLINRIVFDGGGSGPIYFDGLSMTYAGAITDPGGSLPEPGGLALVALAMAGLGLTRRLVARPAQG